MKTVGALFSLLFLTTSLVARVWTDQQGRTFEGTFIDSTDSYVKAFNMEAEKRKAIEKWLDAGMGCCALRHPHMAQVTQETLLKFDGEKYHLVAWCIMPNHVHVLIDPMISLGKIVQSWKSYTGRWAMAHHAELGLGVPRKNFWMREYWDRFIRDEKHLHATVEYMHENPVNANLCHHPEDWLWSSAQKFMRYE